MARKKTWQEKLADSKDLPKVVPITGGMKRRWGEGTVAIPAPRDVDALMRRVSRGRLITIQELRARVAEQQGASVGCPITTGIFAWIAAHAAAEAEDAGKTRVTPYWRTLKTGGRAQRQVSRRHRGGENPPGS